MEIEKAEIWQFPFSLLPVNEFWPNEPVEKVTFLKTASSAGSKIENYFLSSKVFPILGTMLVFS